MPLASTRDIGMLAVMKKHLEKKPLKLKTETLRRLGEKQLVDVGGGRPGDTGSFPPSQCLLTCF